MKILGQQEIMSKDLAERLLPETGLVDTAFESVQLFRVTEVVPCVPAVYKPTVVAILGGTKEAVLDGKHYVYGSDTYLLCPMTLPVEASTPLASETNPLFGTITPINPTPKTTSIGVCRLSLGIGGYLSGCGKYPLWINTSLTFAGIF